jgi:hypothetical protein
METNDDEDLRKEGFWGAYLALKKDTNATDRFLINKAKWEIGSFLRKGRSVDNGFYKRKDLKIIHYTQSPFEDGIFAAVIPDNGKYPVDEQAIFRVDLERFMCLYQKESGNYNQDPQRDERKYQKANSIIFRPMMRERGSHGQ